MKKKALLLLSGGFDSVSTYYLMRDEYEITGLFYILNTKGNEGERAIVSRLSTTENIEVIYSNLFSELRDSRERLVGSEKEEIMKSYVPNRNAYLLLNAMQIASDMGIDKVLFSNTADLGEMPDANNKFVKDIEDLFNTTTLNSPVFIETPIAEYYKLEVFDILRQKGLLSKVLENSISCFNGEIRETEGIIGCGVCDKCATNIKYNKFMQLRDKYKVTEFFKAAYVSIEITRKCNMACKHCFKGKAENMMLQRHTYEAFLAHFSYIDYVIFSGGEPFMELGVVEDIVDVMISIGFITDRVTLNTNGTFVTDYHIETITRIYNKLKKANIDLTVVVSDDKYHLKIDNSSLMELPFTVYTSEYEDRHNNYFEDEELIVPDGRAKKYIKEAKGRHIGISRIYVNGMRLYGGFAITAEDEVAPSGDFSYETMRNDKEHILCNVNDNNYLERAKEYFSKYGWLDD